MEHRLMCLRCSNYIFILDLIPGFNRLGKDHCKIWWEIYNFSDLMRLILECWRYVWYDKGKMHRYQTTRDTARRQHYNDVIMTTIASQITSLTVVYSTVYSDADQRKHQSSVSLAFVWGIHRDRWIPHTKGQLRRNVSIWWRHHEPCACINVLKLSCDGFWYEYW